MKARRHAVGLLVVAAVLSGAASSPAAEETNRPVRAVSVSRQFVAYAANPLLPFAACVFAERVKREWRDRLDLPDSWRDPILIVIESPGASPVGRPGLAVTVFPTELHRKYQITGRLPLEPAPFVTALVEALCAEFANRAQERSAGPTARSAFGPLWLVHGLSQSIQGRNELLLAVARRSLAAGRPQAAVELLATTAVPPDPAERQLLEANVWLFTESLLSLPQGPAKLRRYLEELPGQPADTNAFWKVYATDFPRAGDLEKWWSVQEAERATSVVAQNLSLEETGRQLDEILHTRLVQRQKSATNTVTVGLSELGAYDGQPWLADVLQDKIKRLDLLRTLSVPLYRPVIADYIQALLWLTDRKLVRFRRAWRHGDAARVAADRQAQQISSELDQAEDCYAPPQLANTFANFFQVFEQFEAIQQQRHSPVSDYLDKSER